MYFKPPGIISRKFPSFIWEIPSDREVYLTFDDGPTPGVTEWTLHTLAQYHAKATFFCLGKNAEMYPDIMERIRSEGHRIGNHTYSHQKGWGMSLEDYLSDVEFGNMFLKSDLFRPPYARIKPSQARRLSKHYHIILWDVLSRDYSQWISPRGCYRNVAKHAHPGSIVVFHDSEKAFRNLRYALPKTLELLRDRGWKGTAIKL